MSNSTNEATKQSSSAKATLKKIFNVVFYTFVAIIVILALFITIMSLTSKPENGGLSNVFGYYIQTVESESMTGTFEKGDVIVCKEVKNTDALKEGDIISFHFYDKNKNVNIVVTHRIIKVETAEDGHKYFVTKGDAVELYLTENVAISDVIAQYNGFKIPNMGDALKFVKSKNGFLLCVLLPLFLFLFWQFYEFIMTIIRIKQTNYQEQVNDQAKALAAEMLKQMQEQNGANAPPVVEPSVEQTQDTDVQ